MLQSVKSGGVCIIAAIFTVIMIVASIVYCVYQLVELIVLVAMYPCMFRKKQGVKQGVNHAAKR